MCRACTERRNASERGRKESENNGQEETWEGVFGKVAEGIKKKGRQDGRESDEMGSANYNMDVTRGISTLFSYLFHVGL